MKRCAVWAAVGVPVMVTMRLVVPSVHSPLGDTTTLAPDSAIISLIVEPWRPKMLPTSSSGTERVMVVSVTGRAADSAVSLRGSPLPNLRVPRDSDEPKSPRVEVSGDEYVVPRFTKGIISDCCRLIRNRKKQQTNIEPSSSGN